jgi:Fe2+ or Zn2+ uptake regulation protein
MNYYNSTGEKGKDLDAAQSKSMSQSVIILDAMSKIGKASASDLHKFLNTMQYPILITSVRRSLTDLAEAKKIERLDEKKLSPYKRKEFLFQLIDGK